MAEILGEMSDREALPPEEIIPEEFNPEKAESDLQKASELISGSDMSAEQRKNLSPEGKRLNDAYELGIKNALHELSSALEPLEKIKKERENN